MNLPEDELDLPRRLRQLPRERAPARDLWQQIGPRLAPEGAAHSARRAAPRWVGWAAAASLLLALGLGLGLQPQRNGAALATRASDPVAAPTVLPLPVAATDTVASTLLRREADAITLEYTLALQPFAGQALPPELRAAATELDASARQLRGALREQPEATYLLDRLRHTYDQRLKLTQLARLG